MEHEITTRANARRMVEEQKRISEETISAVSRANGALVEAIKAAHAGQTFDLKSAVADAKEAWLAELPLLDSITNVRLYISCIACGMKMRVLTPQESRAMMFIAQTQLSAMREEKAAVRRRVA
jgi:hypothetical protein